MAVTGVSQRPIILFVVNPKAGDGKGPQFAEQLATLARLRESPTKIYTTPRAPENRADEIAKHISDMQAANPARRLLVVAIGGDKTTADAWNGMVRRFVPNPRQLIETSLAQLMLENKIEFVTVPFGGKNDVASFNGIPGDKALETMNCIENAVVCTLNGCLATFNDTDVATIHAVTAGTISGVLKKLERSRGKSAANRRMLNGIAHSLLLPERILAVWRDNDGDVHVQRMLECVTTVLPSAAGILAPDNPQYGVATNILPRDRWEQMMIGLQMINFHGEAKRDLRLLRPDVAMLDRLPSSHHNKLGPGESITVKFYDFKGRPLNVPIAVSGDPAGISPELTITALQSGLVLAAPSSKNALVYGPAPESAPFPRLYRHHA